MERWDGYHRDGTLAGVELVRGQALPEGIYHLFCEVLVRHADGDYLLMQRDLRKPKAPGCWEATAGGAAQKGEDALACARRELWEETGIAAEKLAEIGVAISDANQWIAHSFLCETDVDKTAIRLQAGETIAFRWLDETAFAAFVQEGMLPAQRARLMPWLQSRGIV